MKEAFDWLEVNFAKFADIPKIAVAGNWDRRRKSWFPHNIWYEKYKRAGFDLLINEGETFGEIHFYGVDEPKMGSPCLTPGNLNPDIYNCIISHSVEPVVDSFTSSEYPGEVLALCGHTHAGQIRIPFFGALFTSTKYWKLFEYGHYYLKRTALDLVLTSGLGKSRLPIRLFCRPEVVIINFNSL